MSSPQIRFPSLNSEQQEQKKNTRNPTPASNLSQQGFAWLPVPGKPHTASPSSSSLCPQEQGPDLSRAAQGRNKRQHIPGHQDDQGIINVPLPNL